MEQIQSNSSDTEAGAPGADPAAGRTVTLSARAVKRIATLKDRDGKPEMMLRVTVTGGGCSGFQYQFGFSDSAAADDHVFSRDGVSVVIDDVSLDLLAGSEIDFTEDLMGAFFKIENPNAASNCGCGASFALA